MKYTAIILAGIILGSATCAIVSCNNGTGPGKDVTVTPGPACNCDSTWFPHSQTPAPAEGNGSPFDTSSTTNCIFHQWSWQKFLWLTKPMSDGKPLFEDSLIEVDNHMIPVPPVSNVHLILEDSTQAGSAGILRSNTGLSADKSSHTVFYAIYVNDVLHNAASSLKNRMLKDHKLLNNSYTFPVGSLEVKTSWIDVNALPDNEVKNYHTADAVIMPGSKKLKVALLGMHVVGVVKNHPEFIWATFEHKEMAPVYNWKGTTTQDLPVTSTDEKLFFKKGDTSTWQNLEWNASAPPKPENVFTVYRYGVPRTAGDSAMAVSQTEPVNLDNIEGLNKCVAANLKDVWQNYFYNGSLWINMDGLSPKQQADTLVNLGYTVGSATPGSIARGSVAAFNITMETFAQDFDNLSLTKMNASSLTNCLSCHSSPASIIIAKDTFNAVSPLYLSHIFRSYLSFSTGIKKDRIEILRIHDFMNMINTRKKLNMK